MIKFFKTVAILEGISYLVLFSNLLLIKPNNIEIYHQLLYPIGMTHGLLFVGYVILALVVGFSKKWNFLNFTIVLLASLLPFATFFVDNKYLKND